MTTFKIHKPEEIKPTTGGRIILAWGLGGAGKTTLGVESADVSQPLYYARFDTRNSDHMLASYKGKALYSEYFPPQTDSAMASFQMNRYKQFISMAKANGDGVFIEDNMATKWDMYKIACLPAGTAKPSPKDYAIGNNAMREDYGALEESQLWTVVTTPAVPLWDMVPNPNTGKNSLQDTGLYQPDGWKHFDYHSVASVYLFRTGKLMAVPMVPQEALSSGTFKALITESKLRPTVVGGILDEPRLADVIKAVT